MKVSAGIFRDGDKILMMRRASNQPCPNAWEFPGGKFEADESGPACLTRELAEELGISATIGRELAHATHVTDSGKEIELIAYAVVLYTGEITLRVHDAMEWVPISELCAHDQLPADLEISKQLQKIYE